MIGKEQHEAFENKTDSDEYLFSGCFNINKKLVPYIHQRLIDDGITEQTIYPDSNIKTDHVYLDCKGC